MKNILSKILMFFGFYHVPREVKKLLKDVKSKVREVELIEDISDEAKRSMVYGSIIKRNTEVKKSSVALAIEIVLRSLK